nr:DUF2520 domain-containing protein [Muribaculaceae bacterium]
KGKPLDYSLIPIMIEGKDLDLLTEVASLWQSNIYQLDSESRRKLHLASVIACNLTNRLWALCEDYLEKIPNPNINMAILQPLLSETVAKIATLSPRLAQTGPAARGDLGTIDKHRVMLGNQPELLAIYNMLTDSILAEKNINTNNRERN